MACKSKRWPGRKREMYGGEGSLNEKRSLGGVRRETIGAAETAENAAANIVAASRMKRG